ncbi:uncharacterized protein LOC133185802 [Saccostrea echinata]|uniref:uncharacterized protein LOC133185802 n=1 Tax=Saccostrea echinata TaxID=191078 RepID=UPI002A82004C|nr:uncharacterized protein LOC133185802 [Saccostrea echinata]
MDFEVNNFNEVDSIKNELASIRNQDEILMQSLLQISKTIQKAAFDSKPVPRLTLGHKIICRHGHTNCLGYNRTEETLLIKRTDAPPQHLSDSLRNLRDITRSIEDMPVSDASDLSSSDIDSD